MDKVDRGPQLSCRSAIEAGEKRCGTATRRAQAPSAVPPRTLSIALEVSGGFRGSGIDFRRGRRVSFIMRCDLHRLAVLLLLVVATGIRVAAADEARAYFGIRVVDEATGRGVPLIELSTVNSIRHWTDSAGWVAFLEPGLMGREVFFHVRGHGYEHPKDGFGYRGLKLRPVGGGTATVRVRRLNVAERLYRITGQGLYRDSLLLGLPVPVREPALNGEVLGQDTVIATPFGGRIHWFWGDTDRASYPLGNFGASGATSALPGPGALDPSTGIDLNYFTNAQGFARAMCPEPNHGLRWIESVFTAQDGQGRERLMARMAHHKDLGPALGWYLLVFDEAKGEFAVDTRWDVREGHDSSHPFRRTEAGVEYLYLYPNFRVRPQLDALRDLNRYESWTCVAGDGRLHGKDTVVERDAGGSVRYSWKAGADRLHPGRLRELARAGLLKPEEGWIDLHDVETGRRVEAGRGSVAWNEYRRRWVMITSVGAGEIWYAEAGEPTGPWTRARRVVAHDEYNFYNPVHHPFLDQADGRIIHFEGTYTAAFSSAKDKTPRYDYNQVMYRLDLDEPRLGLVRDSSSLPVISPASGPGR